MHTNTRQACKPVEAQLEGADTFRCMVAHNEFTFDSVTKVLSQAHRGRSAMIGFS